MACNDNCMKVVRVTELFEDGAFSVITPSLATGAWSHDDGQGNVTIIRSTSSDLGNALVVGSDGGSYIDTAALEELVDLASQSVLTNVNGSGNRIFTHDPGTGGTVDVFETLTTLTNTAGTNMRYTSEDGTITNFDIKGTLTTITNTGAGNLIATYTDEDGGTTNINETVTDLSVSGASDPTVTYTDEAGATDTVQFVGGTNITVTQAADVITINTSAIQSFDITDGVTPQTVEDGETITFAAGGDITVATSATNTVTYSFSETITALVSDADGSYTFTHEDAGTSDIVVVSTDANNDIAVGTDNGAWLSFSTGLDVSSGTITVDASDFIANGANNRVITAVDADNFNAEANLLFDGSKLEVSESVSLHNNNPPTNGEFVDIYHISSEGFIRAYDFDGAQYQALKIDGSTLWLNSVSHGPVNVEGTGSGGVLGLLRDDGVVIPDDTLGTIHFDGLDGAYSTVDASAMIKGHASEAQSATEKGGYLSIYTKANGTNGNEAATERVRVDQDGSIDFLAYGGGSITGTAAQMLGVDNSGNVIEVDLVQGVNDWTEVTTTSQAAAVQNSYIANNAALVTVTLPATAAIGDRVQVVGKGAGLFKIGQNAGQTVHVSGSSTTTGVGGSLTAQNQYDAIELVCITANTDWAALSTVGTFTVV